MQDDDDDDDHGLVHITGGNGILPTEEEEEGTVYVAFALSLLVCSLHYLVSQLYIYSTTHNILVAH